MSPKGIVGLVLILVGLVLCGNSIIEAAVELVSA